MKTMRIVLFIALMAISIPATAQIDGTAAIAAGRTQIEAAVKSWQLDALMAARAHFERLAGQTDQEAWALYYLAYAESRIVNFYFSEENMDDAKPFVNAGIAHLETSLEINPANADAKALLASLLGNKIAFNPFSGMTLGPKSGRLIGEAFALAPENPRVSLIAGQSAFYTPKMFGGGKEKALKHFQEALKKYRHNAPAEPLAPRWGRVDAHIYCGLSHMDLKEYAEARTAFNQALTLEPGHGWVSLVLLPELEKRASAE